MTIYQQRPVRARIHALIQRPRNVPTQDWKAQAIAAYQQRGEGLLRAALVRRVYALTGQDVLVECIWTDDAERCAGVAVNGTLFRWEHGQLVLLRPCIHCGSGTIASPPLQTQADLGYALSAWQPRHPSCQPDDENEW